MHNKMKIDLGTVTTTINFHGVRYKVDSIDREQIVLIGINPSKRVVISYDHHQDCCEYNYCDFEAVDDSFKTLVIDKLYLEAVVDKGIRINQHFIPCYSDQNGYYTNELELHIKAYTGDKLDGSLVFDITIGVEEPIRQ